MTYIMSPKDTFRQSVEAASGGKNTVIYDDKGYPSVMVRIPKFNLSDVIDGALATPHPAFIVNGEVKDEILISKYQNIVHDGRACSVPGQEPRVFITLDQAKAACTAKGAGWHLMTNAEWAAIALWSKKNGTLPRGNNNFGADHAYAHEKILVATKDEQGRTLHGKTGTGPVAWSHDGTTDGIFDLNGNVWEWCDGLKVVDGRIVVMSNNSYNTNESQWQNTPTFFDNVGGLVLNNSRTATNGGVEKTFSDLSAASGYTIPDLLKNLAIAPHDKTSINDIVFVDLEGERYARRGGHWGSDGFAGAFALSLSNVRSNSTASAGFRSAYIAP